MKLFAVALVAGLGIFGQQAFAKDANNVTPEFLTIKAAADALSYPDKFELPSLSWVTGASSIQSPLSTTIEISYRSNSGAQCTAFSWWDFAGNPVSCDPCRDTPSGSGCACASAMCTTDTELLTLTNGKITSTKR
jgi:hypothetical protein